MKRLVLTPLLILFTLIYSYAQVIDIVGIGVAGEANPNLIISDVGNINHVDVAAFYKGPGILPLPTDVQFSDSDEDPVSAWNTDIILKGSPAPHDIGYYTATFNTFDNLLAQII